MAAFVSNNDFISEIADSTHSDEIESESRTRLEARSFELYYQCRINKRLPSITQSFAVITDRTLLTVYRYVLYIDTRFLFLCFIFLLCFILF